MTFDLREALAVLERTPSAMSALLKDVPAPWHDVTEGPETFSPRDVVGHLIGGERTDWIPRARLIIERGESEAFAPFDRFAFRREIEGKHVPALLDEFAALRHANLDTIRGFRLGEADLDRRGRHPDFGPVTLRQLLACWVVHDLGHIGQIVRVMAKRYREEVGPWVAYLPVLTRGPQ